MENMSGNSVIAKCIDCNENNGNLVNLTHESGDAIRESLRQAALEHRLICGAYDTGLMLQQCPNNVMMCIIPDQIPDSTLHININLIDAFCQEHGIRKIKVDDFNRLVTLLPTLPGNDFSCIIIQYPTTEYSDADKTLLKYYDAITQNTSNCEAVVILPDIEFRHRVNTM